nr:aspartate--tRNA(Asn) ligase [Geodermatophilaceae bacterium]
MERIRTTEAGQHVGERVRVAGWLHALRRMGGITFLVVRDGWGTVQAVVGAEQAGALAPLETAGALVETVLEVEGTVRAQPQAPDGVEIAEPVIRVITAVTEPPPVAISKKEIRAALP